MDVRNSGVGWGGVGTISRKTLKVSERGGEW